MSLPAPSKKRVLYIRHRRKREMADGFRMNQDEWHAALAALADVTTISDSFDLAAMCGRIHPDFIIYESPYFFAEPLDIANPLAHGHIPRFGLQIQDPYCATRVAFLRRVEQLGIRYIFTPMAEAALRQSPELAPRLLSVTMLFDPALFYDRGLPRDIPVSVFGGFLLPEIYHWRAETAAAISRVFPTLIYTHPGYAKPVARHKFAVAGEDYARLLSRSHFSLADTTRVDCLVRKHLEIPACGTILVAPDTPALKPYGFRDMENCILGSGAALFAKIAAVADDPALYEKIRRNGYDLAHARFRRENWRGILDCFDAWQRLQPGQSIRQRGIMGACVAVDGEDGDLSAIDAEIPQTMFSTAIKQWLDGIIGGESFDRMTARLDDMSEWLPFFEEQWVPLGIMALLKGDPHHAKTMFLRGRQLRVQAGAGEDDDPEEIAWLSLTGALTGDGELLKATRVASASMRHLSLRRMQWLGTALAAGGDLSQPPADTLRRKADDHISIHGTGQWALADWLGVIRRILVANGQGGILR